MHENYDLDLLLELVEQRKFRSLKELLSQMNEVDIAEFLDELDVEQEILVFRLLPKDTAAEVFTYLENTEDQEKLIGALSDRELREVLDELYLDDTVDIIEDMPANVVSRILRNTDASTRSQINQLLNYPKDSAGSIMTTEFVFLHPDATVEESFARIRSVGIDKETIYTCYVTQNRVLLGVVTVRRMLLSSYETRIRDIMETNVLSVNTHEDKEDVAQLLNKYDLSAIPVVDGDNRLVGIVTVDDAVGMCVLERRENADGNLHCRCFAQPPFFADDVLERLPLDVLHDEVAVAAGIHADIQQVDDVVVRHFRRGFRLPLKARDVLRILIILRFKNFDGDEMLCIEVGRAVNHRHAAHADLLINAVAAGEDAARLNQRIHAGSSPSCTMTSVTLSRPPASSAALSSTSAAFSGAYWRSASRIWRSSTKPCRPSEQASHRSPLRRSSTTTSTSTDSSVPIARVMMLRIG